MDTHGETIDGTIPVAALLFPDEILLAEQDNVGLYDGNVKAPHHQQGSVYITSHRWFYIDSAHPRRNSLAFKLLDITHIEYYGGFLTSSAKITIFFHPRSAASILISPGEPNKAGANSANPNPISSSGNGFVHQPPQSYAVSPSSSGTTFKWECEICGNKNVSTGLVPSAVCELCGVPRSSTMDTSTAGPSSLYPQSRNIPQSSSNHGLSRGRGDATFTSKSLPTSVVSTPGRGPSPSNDPSVTSTGGSRSTELRPQEDDDPDAQVPCSACTFLNYPSLRNCEICGTPLPKWQRRTSTSIIGSKKMNSEPSSRPSSPHRDKEMNDMVRISFRKGGDKALHAALKGALEAKVWQVVEPTLPVKNRTGIHGLVEFRRTKEETTNANMQAALQDMDAFMKQAGEMMALAESFNRSLREHEASRQKLPEDARFIIDSSMARLGLISAVPASASSAGKGDDTWLDGLVKELAIVLLGPNGDGGFMKNRGMVGLDEVWGAWNRARGVDLLPPSTFMQVLQLLPQHTRNQLLTRSFHSNLKVVHTPWYSQKSFSSRLLTYLRASGPKSLSQVAQQENLSIGLVAEMIGSAEREGSIIRDEEGASLGARQVRWWPNVFDGYIWDGD
ncbi:hypothetical protein FRC19_003546 [Serendipita sp. 401]|nr:hypothetical protein FRC19_003546 [Serendipita sp. 401]KAG9057896.1 hypothetical protein FS842_003216 [Serendipita sp. 407]